MSVYPIAPKMPEPIQAVFGVCLIEHTAARRKTKMVRQLYGSGPEAIFCMNQAAPQFFKDVKYALLDEISLSISRLTDDPETGKKPNLVLGHLIALVEADQPGHLLITELRNHLQAAIEKADLIRNKRNKLIAHNDRNLLTSGEQVFLTPGSETLRIIFGHFDFILNKIQVIYDGREYPVDVLEQGGDADSLIRKLEEGNKAICELARLRSETGTPIHF